VTVRSAVRERDGLSASQAVFRWPIWSPELLGSTVAILFLFSNNYLNID
jgi:hypothetical protein